MKKIKILRIIARLNIGGPAIHTILLTSDLDKTRFQSLLISGCPEVSEGDMSYYASEKEVKPVFIPELRRKLALAGDIAALTKIYKVIKAEQPDIIHTHTAKAGALGRLSGILYNLLHSKGGKQVRLIHTFHGHVLEGYFGKLKTRIFILIERFLAIFTSRIITVSDSVKNELIALRICKPEKINVIPLGFELEKFFEVPFTDKPASNIGIVGRLVPIKNHRLFLEAAARVITDNPGIGLRFKIVGDGELRGALEEHSRKLNIDGQVDFLGWQKDLAQIYTNLDIVALTSINEGTPVSLIEAMASGRAVVATDVGGVRDLLGEEVNTGIKPDTNFMVLERGIIVKPQDSFGFAAALNFILRNSAVRKNMAERARGFAKERFTKDRLIMDIENLYNGVLGSRP